VVGTGDIELSAALDDARVESVAGLAVKCEGTMTGVGRGGGGHWREEERDVDKCSAGNTMIFNSHPDEVD
jgi:hypothetical protein